MTTRHTVAPLHRAVLWRVQARVPVAERARNDASAPARDLSRWEGCCRTTESKQVPSTHRPKTVPHAPAVPQSAQAPAH
jgi:hypothetical protein